jgi:hypothetical protein
MLVVILTPDSRRNSKNSIVLVYKVSFFTHESVHDVTALSFTKKSTAHLTRL